jgi:hypothetical protein
MTYVLTVEERCPAGRVDALQLCAYVMALARERSTTNMCMRLLSKIPIP